MFATTAVDICTETYIHAPQLVFRRNNAGPLLACSRLTFLEQEEKPRKKLGSAVGTIRNYILRNTLRSGGGIK